MVKGSHGLALYARSLIARNMSNMCYCCDDVNYLRKKLMKKDEKYEAFKDLAKGKLRQFVNRPDVFNFRWDTFHGFFKGIVNSSMREKFERECKRDGDRLLCAAFAVPERSLAMETVAGDINLTGLKAEKKKLALQEKLDSQDVVKPGLAEGERVSEEDLKYSIPFSSLREGDEFETRGGKRYTKLSSEICPDGNADAASGLTRVNFEREHPVKRL